MGNTINLKHRVLKDLFTFLSQSKNFKNINFKNFNRTPIFEKYKCLVLSKNLSIYLKDKNIENLTTSYILSIIFKHSNKNDMRFCKKNIELIKFYTLLFSEKSCSHLAIYLFKNLNISSLENRNCLCVTIKKKDNLSIILNENLDIFTKKFSKKDVGEIFFNTQKSNLFQNIEHRALLLIFSIFISYTLICNIPSNHLIIEMNSTTHIKMNHKGNIISCKPKGKISKNIVKNTKHPNKNINSTLPKFLNYGLENQIIKPGEKINIYITGPPLNKKLSESLKSSLTGLPLNIIINNSGNLIKINRT